MDDKRGIDHYVQAFGDLPAVDVAALTTITRERKLTSGQVYIEAGSDSRKLAYIRKGLIRAYHLKPNGDDLTLMLRWENQFIASVDGIIYHRPNRFVYQAIEDTELLEMDYYEAEKIIEKSLPLSSTRHVFLLHMLGEAMERVEGFVLLSAEERYLKLQAELPDLYNRVPDKYLATLLGITPVSLSRIRKRIASGK